VRSAELDSRTHARTVVVVLDAGAVARFDPAVLEAGAAAAA
jgi:hypothetical protein